MQEAGESTDKLKEKLIIQNREVNKMKDEVSEIMKEITENTEIAERDTAAAEKKEKELEIDKKFIQEREAEANEQYLEA
ncbi:MAG: hypothetical protein IPK55_12745 [Streptococcus sp.]|nr:hypothetical protein [Streptococcus sp.]